MIILGLAIAMLLCFAGYALGRLDADLRRSNAVSIADEVAYSFRHLTLDRYVLLGIVMIVLISLIPRRVASKPFQLCEPAGQ